MYQSTILCVPSAQGGFENVALGISFNIYIESKLATIHQLDLNRQNTIFQNESVYKNLRRGERTKFNRSHRSNTKVHTAEFFPRSKFYSCHVTKDKR